MMDHKTKLPDPNSNHDVDRNCGTPIANHRFRLLGNGLTTICGLGTAFPSTVFTQEEVATLLNITNPTVKKLMASGHVRTRHLYLPVIDPRTNTLPDESPSDLHRKFHDGITDIGVQAAERAIKDAGLVAGDIDHLIAVTSTGFALPGMSSIISRTLNMRSNLHRLDVVGMGCNAGMSALCTAAKISSATPEQNILIICCEINSASYICDNTIRTGIVNSLFGDGAAAVVLSGNATHQSSLSNKLGSLGLRLYDFETLTIPQQHETVRFDWDVEKNKWSLFLSKDIPFAMGRNINRPVEVLLSRHGLSPQDVQHWAIHTGGGAVIDGAKASLNLTEYDVRHTRSVLADFGNLSSGSFFVSLERLHQEGVVQLGDIGVLIAMGPGATIEASLCRWE